MSIEAGSAVCTEDPRTVGWSSLGEKREGVADVLLEDDAPLEALACTFFFADIRAQMLKFAALRYMYFAGVVTLRVGIT